MQHFPPSPSDNARRPAVRDGRAREAVAIPSVEEHRDQAELDASVDWLAHIPVLSLPKGAAGRVEVRRLARARGLAAFAAFRLASRAR